MQKVTRAATRKKLLISVFIFLVAFFPRIIDIQKTPIFGDEVTWTVWGKELMYSIFKGNMASYSQKAWYNDKSVGHNIGIPLTELIGSAHILLTNESKDGLHLLPPIIASRYVNVTISLLIPVAIFLIGSMFFPPVVAFSASIFYALTPIVIGVDRWVFNDSFLTLFTFLAVGLFCHKFEKKQYSILPGIFLGLAFLTKVVGLLPLVAWIIFLISKKNRPYIVKMLIINLLAALIPILILWPESWRRPVISIFEYTFKMLYLPGDATPSFYFGKSTLDPGPTFYFFQLFARLPEIIVVLLPFSLLAYLRAIKRRNLTGFAVLIFCAIYFLWMSIAPLKTSFRYILPILPWLYLGLSDFIFKQKIINHALIFIFIIVLLVIADLYFHPDYYVYYNQFIGGPGRAAYYDQVPLCYASKDALKYLDKNHINGTVYVSGCRAGEPYYHSPRTFLDCPDKADIVIIGGEFLQKASQDKIDNVKKNKHLIKKIEVKDSPVGEIWYRND